MDAKLDYMVSNPVFLNQGEVFLSSDLLPGLLGQGFLRPAFVVKTEARKSFSILIFSATSVARVPVPFSGGPTFSSVYSFCY